MQWTSFLVQRSVACKSRYMLQKLYRTPSVPGKLPIALYIIRAGCQRMADGGELSMKTLGFLLPGRGSNFEAIAKNVAQGNIPNARIGVVISNRPEAGGIAIARQHG